MNRRNFVARSLAGIAGMLGLRLATPKQRMTVPILRAGVVNSNGRFYPVETMRQAVEKLHGQTIPVSVGTETFATAQNRVGTAKLFMSGDTLMADLKVVPGMAYRTKAIGHLHLTGATTKEGKKVVVIDACELTGVYQIPREKAASYPGMNDLL